MNRKKVLIIGLILVALTLNSTLNVKGDVLPEIKVGDNWVYKIDNQSTNLFYQTTKESNLKVAVNVTGNKYIPAMDSTSEIKTNIIETNYTIDEYKIMELNDLKIPIFFNSINNNVSLNATFIFSSPTKDNIYKTSRGNILYSRTTIFNVTVYITDLVINNINYKNRVISRLVGIDETSDNPLIITTITDGSVRINHRLFQFHQPNSQLPIDDVEGIISNITNGVLDLNYVITERYEASDTFEYKGYKCRNITITSISGDVDFIAIGDVNEMTINVPIPLIQEDWIYAYDVGLPLQVTKKIINEPSKLSNNQQKTANVPIIGHMILDSFDIANAKVKTTETSTSATPINLTMIITATILLAIRQKVKKRRKI